MEKFEYEPAPLALAFVLGPVLERGLRQSLKLSGGSFWIFFNRPLSATLLGLAVLLFASYFFLKKRREVLDQLEE
jgi:putative tricarboxylic transport membrane protein